MSAYYARDIREVKAEIIFHAKQGPTKIPISLYRSVLRDTSDFRPNYDGSDFVIIEMKKAGPNQWHRYIRPLKDFMPA